MLYKNALIFTVDGRFVHGSFRVERGHFADVLDFVPREPGMDLKNALVLPGLVDLHIHGAVGADCSDGSYEGLAAMGRYLARHGVTSFAPATMTLPYKALDRAFSAAKQLYDARPDDCARLLGVHMEGPYFSEAKKGAQNPAYLKTPDAEGFLDLYDRCGGLIRIVDLAPELPGAEEFIRTVSPWCTVSVGHTDAVYEEATMAFEAGASHLTHLFNCMPSIHHRNPGVIGAAAERGAVTAELICDGLHIHPSAVRMAFKLFPGRICLVSDALRCCGMADGDYLLGGQNVHLEQGIARLADGTIAGSATNLYDCLRRAVSFGIPLEDAVRSATILPAKILGCDWEIGSIEPGKAADFIVCTKELDLLAVYVDGKRLS